MCYHYVSQLMLLNLRNTRSDSGYMADPGYKPGVLTPKLANCTTTPAWISQQDQKLASLSQMVPSGPPPEWLSICGSQPTWLPSLGMSAYLMFISGLLLLKLEHLVTTYAKDWFHHILNPYTSGLTVTPGSGAGAPWPSTLIEHPAAGSLGPGVPCSVAEFSQPDQHISKALWHE